MKNVNETANSEKVISFRNLNLNANNSTMLDIIDLLESLQNKLDRKAQYNAMYSIARNSESVLINTKK